LRSGALQNGEIRMFAWNMTWPMARLIIADIGSSDCRDLMAGKSLRIPSPSGLFGAAEVFGSLS
jgi:hypothetical protein